MITGSIHNKIRDGDQRSNESAPSETRALRIAWLELHLRRLHAHSSPFFARRTVNTRNGNSGLSHKDSHLGTMMDLVENERLQRFSFIPLLAVHHIFGLERGVFPVRLYLRQQGIRC